MTSAIGKTRIWSAAIVVVAAVAALYAVRARAASEPPAAGDHKESMMFGGYDRTFLVHVPPRRDDSSKLPVVIMLHGAGGSSEGAARETGWSVEADKEGFLAVYPEAMPGRPGLPASFLGNPRLWNDGSGRGRLAPTIDDTGFLGAVMDQLVKSYGADPARIYVTGMSNGASMTFRTGIVLANRVAAIAPVAGRLWVTDQQLPYPVPLLFIIGSADPLNPIAGGDIKLPWGMGKTEHRGPIGDSLSEWRAMLGCTSDSRTLADGGGVKAIEWDKCAKGGVVEYYTVDGLGHVWPGGTTRLPERWIGKASDKLDATVVIWEFFKSHPRQ
ncbi:MAG TPA: PHB depolymerase family esterase [Candidatus Binataceae bacterium]|nr:PHB depolymerase family esterase [Candidatus Binataceae bacterium]